MAVTSGLGKFSIAGIFPNFQRCERTPIATAFESFRHHDDKIGSSPHIKIATYVANDLIRINVFVSEQGYCELEWGYLWMSVLEKVLASELIRCVYII